MSNRVLVLMSSFNGQNYIREQIRSIMLQDSEYQIDLRIRDDGSNDGTCQTITEMQREYPGRIELIRGERIGYNASFFRLLNDADGYKYYALSDQDDVWLPNKVQVACEHLDKENSDSPLLFASTSYLVGDDLKPYGKTRTKVKEFCIYNTIIQNICPGHTQVMNNAMLEYARGDVDPSRIYVYDSWITNLAVLYGKVIFSNDSYTYYRQHRNSLFGSGVGFFGQLLTSCKRTKSGDGFKYRKQIEYFVYANEMQLSKEGLLEALSAFTDADTFSKKLRCLLRCKLHRQSKLETIAFYFSVLTGGF